MLTANKEKDFRQTEGWKTIWAKHEEVIKSGTSAIVELEPIHSRVYGNVHMKATIKDNFGNIVYDNKEGRTRFGMNGHGMVLRYEVEDHLRAIYAIKHCPSVSKYLAFDKASADPQTKRFLVKDIEAMSKKYADEREERVIQQGKIYAESEEVIDLLCTLVGLPTTASLGTKRASLCEAYEEGEAQRTKITLMLRNEDKRYYVAAYRALKEEVFVKTPSGVYKHNEQVLGNHIDQIIAYLKQSPDVYTMLEKGKELVDQKAAIDKENAPKKPK